MRKLWLILSAMFLLVAACGDDDADSAAGDGSGDDTSADVSDDNGDSSDEDSGGGDAAAFLDDSNCDFVLEGSLNPLAEGFDPSQSPDFDELGDQFQDVADAAPEEIHDDMQLLAEGYNEFLDLIGDVDMSDPESFQDPEVQQAFSEAEAIFDEEFQNASDRVSTYFEENCQS